MIKNTLYFLTFILFLLMISSCNNGYIYKVGNRITLDYEIKTRINFKILRKYIDKMVIMEEYKVPKKWEHYDKLVSTDSIDNKRIYFKENPEEMYLIQFNGVLLLADVFNESIVKGDWVAYRNKITSTEESRIKKRFKTEILDKIEMMAKRDKVPDSILFFKPFDTVQ